MTVEIKPGFILVSDIIDGQLVKEKYIGYSVREAKKLFTLTQKATHDTGKTNHQ